MTVHGNPSAALVATQDLDALEVTIEIQPGADTTRRLHASEAERARGEAEIRKNLDVVGARRRGSRP